MRTADGQRGGPGRPRPTTFASHDRSVSRHRAFPSVYADSVAGQKRGQEEFVLDRKFPKWEVHLDRKYGNNYGMRVIAIKRLRECWQKEPAAEQALRAWYAEAEEANWETPAEIKAKYGNASILRNGR